ncbi:MAG: radical SAM protein [Rhodothermus sp.]|nr:radical SAM protein [Rhodothermus sp.]
MIELTRWETLTPLARTRLIRKLRPPRAKINPERPYAFHHELERAPDGRLERVNVVFLTNRECPWTCTMCDLWRHTTTTPVTADQLLRQLDYALEHLPEADAIKLYNSGSFFDRLAIPPTAYQGIAERLRGYRRIIVESHPALIGPRTLQFQELLEGQLEVAIGVECIHPDVLNALNKRLTIADLEQAVTWLHAHHLLIRAFILLKPPFLPAAEALTWTCHTVRWAVTHAIQIIVLIPTRTGNGIMDHLARSGQFAPPTPDDIETATAFLFAQQAPVRLLDTWDLPRFYPCPDCARLQQARFARMNQTQTWEPAVHCPTCNPP